MTSNFEMVSVDNLLITNHHGTQRVEGVREKRVEEIANSWDPSKVGTITVSRRPDGSLFVPDGAHRVSAARIVGQSTLPAIVHNGLSHSEEAALFTGLNTFTQPSPISRFLARAAEGEEVANEIKGIVQAHGWNIAQNGDRGSLSAIAAAERVYRSAVATLPDGRHPEVLDWTLDVITAAWEYDRESAHGAILQGLGQLVGRFGPDIDTKRLVAEMAQTRPNVILGKAKTMRDSVGGTLPAHVAKVLVGLHNARKRANKLPEWVWTR